MEEGFGKATGKESFVGDVGTDDAAVDDEALDEVEQKELPEVDREDTVDVDVDVSVVEVEKE